MRQPADVWSLILAINIYKMSNFHVPSITVTILCSVLNWWTPSYFIFIRQQNNLFNHANLLLQVCITLILRAFEPHHFRQFSTEQSIWTDRMVTYKQVGCSFRGVKQAISNIQRSNNKESQNNQLRGTRMNQVALRMQGRLEGHFNQS